ncbi:hypothetical protein ACVWWP_002526 [Bradyrhizobium sp. LM3.6]
MMSANYISTLMLSSSLRSSVTNNQAALAKASKELPPPAALPTLASSLVPRREATSPCERT